MTMSKYYARKTDPITSHWAAAQTDGEKRQGQILEILWKYGPCTSLAVSKLLGISETVTSPSFIKLEEKGVIYRNRIVKNPQTDREAWEWALTPVAEVAQKAAEFKEKKALTFKTQKAELKAAKSILRKAFQMEFIGRQIKLAVWETLTDDEKELLRAVLE